MSNRERERASEQGRKFEKKIMPMLFLLITGQVLYRQQVCKTVLLFFDDGEGKKRKNNLRLPEKKKRIEIIVEADILHLDGERERIRDKNIFLDID